MSDRAAKLLLSVADWIRVDDRCGETGTMAIGSGLAGEILAWSKGYREHLAHVMERKAGAVKVATREYRLDLAMSDELALARVREMVDNRLAHALARREAAELMELWNKEETE